jgi:hypothetical protein
MFLKPFVVDRWILVSSPSPDREAVVARVSEQGLVASSFLRSGEGHRRGCLGPGAGDREAGVRQAVSGPSQQWGKWCRVGATGGQRWR